MSIEVLYRKRLIPKECILLKDDIVVKQTNDILVTKWKALHPKPLFSQGASCYYLNKGIKVSKFCREDGSLYCYYCDIVAYEQKDERTLYVTDQLADVTIFPDGSVQVIDLDELAIALSSDLISPVDISSILFRLNDLLSVIYSGHFNDYTLELNNI